MKRLTNAEGIRVLDLMTEQISTDEGWMPGGFAPDFLDEILTYEANLFQAAGQHCVLGAGVKVSLDLGLLDLTGRWLDREFSESPLARFLEQVATTYYGTDDVTVVNDSLGRLAAVNLLLIARSRLELRDPSALLEV